MRRNISNVRKYSLARELGILRPLYADQDAKALALRVEANGTAFKLMLDV